jgi:hypothetical protein
VEAVPGWSTKGTVNYRSKGGWTDYTWEGLERVAFRFRLDSGGPAVDMTDFLHAGSLEGYVHVNQDRPNVFAGIVCVRD